MKEVIATSYSSRRLKDCQKKQDDKCYISKVSCTLSSSRLCPVDWPACRTPPALLPQAGPPSRRSDSLTWRGPGEMEDWEGPVSYLP